MRTISIKRLREFWQMHPDAEDPLRNWYRSARKATWRQIQDVRVDYPHADAVLVASGRPITVFNIGGNKYRLLVDIRYRPQIMFVCMVLKHADYSKNRWKDEL